MPRRPAPPAAREGPTGKALEKAGEILEDAVRRKIIPGGVFLAGSPISGERGAVFRGLLGRTRNLAPTSPETLYDLASLTKLVSTANLTLQALSRDPPLFTLESPLPAFFPRVPADLCGITIRDLLAHQSGLPPWRPLHLLAQAEDYEERKALAAEAVLKERPLFHRGGSVLYSDLGFILLGFILEKVSRKNLRELFQEMVSSPLDLKATLFSPLKAGGETAPGPVAPTEDGLRAGGPLDYPGVPFLGAVSPGVVHDDNARYLGGAAGHAGLFSRAEDLFQIAASFARSSSPAAPKRQKELLAEFLTPRRASDGKSRPLGFDVLALNKGSLFGHAGYTGTAWWWSPHLDRVMILLCNRVHPTSRGIGAAELRRSLVEASFPEFF